MVRASKFSSKQVSVFFFTPVLDDQDEPTSIYRCRCSKIRKQDPGTGYTNLLSHVRHKHPDYEDTMTSSGAGSGTLVAFTDTKSETIYCWLDWTVSCNLPFTFVEDDTVRKYSSLATICTETLVKYLGLLTAEVEQAIIVVLPKTFGIVFDGWTFHSEHYIAVFAVFEHDGQADPARDGTAGRRRRRRSHGAGARHVSALNSQHFRANSGRFAVCHG